MTHKNLTDKNISIIKQNQIKIPIESTNMEQYNKRTHSYNYGLALIKMLMCFEVVLIHFWNEYVPLFLVPFDMLKGVAVPAFMF